MPVPTVDPPELLDPDVLADPYPTYQRLREQAPVGWCEPIGAWLITGWAPADAVLRDPRTRSTGFRRREAQVRAIGGQFDDLLRIVGRQMVFMDQSDHTRVRRALQAAFTPKAIEALRPHVAALVDEHLDQLPLDGDLMAGLAVPLPAIVIAEVLGVPPDERDRFIAWSHALVEFVGTGRTDEAFLVGTQRAMREWSAFFAELAATSHSSVLATLLEQRDHGELSWDELIANAIFLLAAGHETTTNLVGNGALALARQPEAWARLRAEPDLVAPAIEELLRFDAPVQLVGRGTAAPIDLDGTTIPSGADLVLVVGAANRDPAVFPDPDVLRLDRQPNRHLSFVQGPHHCLGAALARLEGQEALRALVARHPRLDAPDRPSWRPNPAFRGLEALRVG